MGQENLIKKDSNKAELPQVAKFIGALDFNEPKNILIAGEGSYIGENFKQYMSKHNNYKVDIFNTMSNEWNKIDFSKYDVIYDVAGIAHVKETADNRSLYYEVNTKLAVEIAKKAKAEGVKQFIYLSSMSVYGLAEGKISFSTPVNPVNEYGKSKLEAEKILWDLNDKDFTVAIVRPPMVFGKACKGNYQHLRNFALKIRVFPDYFNERSMIYVDNLSSAIRGIIHNGEGGLYFPQNIRYITTFDMVKEIAELNQKKIWRTKLLNVFIKVAASKIAVLKKVFGTLIYDQNMNVPDAWISVKDNGECIKKTEA